MFNKMYALGMADMSNISLSLVLAQTREKYKNTNKFRRATHLLLI